MNKYESLSVTDNINKDDHLYRYISLAQFISLIENQKLFLRKVKSWDDTWEAPDDQLPIIMDDGSERYAESLIVTSTVGQCWTYEKDSDAMWRIYSSNRQGIMIETDVDSFFEIDNLKRAVLAKVIYFNKSNYIEKRYEIANNKSYHYAGEMALKREAFKHENEVRLLVCLQGYRDIENWWDIPVVGFNINPNTFIKSITFDPRADEWFVDAMKKYCQSKGLICPIGKSTLYERNFYEEAKIVRQYKVVTETDKTKK
ncbi:Protein of unknown function (DUF2971) [Desulfitobacterium dichloroeliminans LMG P-21439]|uniref:DUF2971 domain-containing protein n=1 Tax=Desulfitobacterium dichloroeliminans (strain LMG P-21439 / DCA1) TaxID=871963 RepID=L0F6Q8_DESDL|nr:DUF2971 domain-containing protein [Desulfitobacterium dichloroeliminans]AGA68710.1 Protein of unknown function (DUF2971) [Desulfitobacterium dichloroeliminans LMG P-21439]